MKVVIVDDLGLVLSSYGSKCVVKRIKPEDLAEAIKELMPLTEVRAKVRDPSAYRVLIKLLGIEPAWLDGQSITPTDKVFVLVPKPPPHEIEFYEVKAWR